MQVGLIILFICNFLSGFENEQTAINQLLDGWHLAAEKANAAIYFETMADDAVFIGTDPDEYWIKSDFQKWAEPYFRRQSAWTFKPQKRNVYLSPDSKFAWFDELLLSEHYGLCRGSGVLERVNEKWQIKHYVLSFAIHNDKVERIMSLIKKNMDNRN